MDWLVATKAEKANKESGEGRPTLRTELWGLLLLTLGVCLFLALVSFSRTDRFSETGVVNLIGPVGGQVADLTLRSVGLCAFFFDGVLIFCGVSLLFGRRLKLSPMESAGYVLAVPTGAVFLDLTLAGERILGHKPGGFFGELGAEIGRSLIGPMGTVVVTVAALILSVTFITETNPSILARRLWSGLRKAFAAGASFLSGLGHRTAEKLREGLQKAVVWLRDGRAHEAVAEGPAEGPDRIGLVRIDLVGGAESADEGHDGPKPEKRRRFRKKRGKSKKQDDEPEVVASDGGGDSGNARVSAPVIPKPAPTAVAVTIPEPMRQPATKTDAKNSQIQLELEARRAGSGFELPSTSLLAAPKVSVHAINEDHLQDCAAQLEQALSEFKIKGKITGITPGPVVTMFEFEPAPGVKVASIAALCADLARVIRAASVRIAPIPGRGVVGIEVPNQKRDMVFLREVLEHKAFTDSRAKLPLAIGKDIRGHVIVTDLAKMPHLLVAGSTGSGKSVAINAMVMSLLYQASPEDVRLIMVDPKMLELSIYEGIPHLLVPVVTEPGKAATALKWTVDEMERRYHALSAMKVRNIVDYNREVARLREEAAGKPDPDEELPEKMPFIVVVIDEFADLMMVASKDVEICVARLAQKARAAGVHLILATQRPSVDVITGLIKANFPTRISFRVFSKVDSRTVLDVQGAENLLGMGDMLFRPPGRGDLVRVHGAYVDEKEIDRAVEFLKQQGEPDYREEILIGDTSDSGDPSSDDIDEMYDMAIQVVTESRKASISYVQRRLKVGYNRAARMIEMMERDGIIGPSDGRGGREVYAPPPPPD